MPLPWDVATQPYQSGAWVALPIWWPWESYQNISTRTRYSISAAFVNETERAVNAAGRLSVALDLTMFVVLASLKPSPDEYWTRKRQPTVATWVPDPVFRA